MQLYIYSMYCLADIADRQNVVYLPYFPTELQNPSWHKVRFLLLHSPSHWVGKSLSGEKEGLPDFSLFWEPQSFGGVSRANTDTAATLMTIRKHIKLVTYVLRTSHYKATHLVCTAELWSCHCALDPSPSPWGSGGPSTIQQERG